MAASQFLRVHLQTRLPDQRPFLVVVGGGEFVQQGQRFSRPARAEVGFVDRCPRPEWSRAAPQVSVAPAPSRRAFCATRAPRSSPPACLGPRANGSNRPRHIRGFPPGAVLQHGVGFGPNAPSSTSAAQQFLQQFLDEVIRVAKNLPPLPPSSPPSLSLEGGNPVEFGASEGARNRPKRPKPPSSWINAVAAGEAGPSGFSARSRSTTATAAANTALYATWSPCRSAQASRQATGDFNPAPSAPCPSPQASARSSRSRAAAAGISPVARVRVGPHALHRQPVQAV